jgi:hypothetical protein
MSEEQDGVKAENGFLQNDKGSRRGVFEGEVPGTEDITKRLED